MPNWNAKGEIVAEAIWKSVDYSNSSNSNKIAANQKLHECCKQGKAGAAAATLTAAAATLTAAAATNEKWALWVDGWLSQGCS